MLRKFNANEMLQQLFNDNFGMPTGTPVTRKAKGHLPMLESGILWLAAHAQIIVKGVKNILKPNGLLKQIRALFFLKVKWSTKFCFLAW